MKLLAFFLLFFGLCQKTYANRLYTEITMDKAGGVGLGLDFEINPKPALGYGAYSRIFLENAKEGQNGAIALGGYFRPYIPGKVAAFFISPGFGLIRIDTGAGDEIVFGPSFMTGFNYKLGSSLIGFNITQLYGWIGEVRGAIEQSFMISYVLQL
ncbi:MAG: hypothetical protein AB7T49_18050 [Oligoflexales bacterium]